MKQIVYSTMGLAAGCLLITTVIKAQDYPSILPLQHSEITSPYGQRIHPVTKQQKHHSGVDLKAPLGTPVIATAPGTVTRIMEESGGYGKYVIIEHDTYKTKYAQLSGFEVVAGQEVKLGQVIGYVGSSGMATAPHLHYELLIDEQSIDPLPHVKKL